MTHRRATDYANRGNPIGVFTALGPAFDYVARPAPPEPDFEGNDFIDSAFDAAPPPAPLAPHHQPSRRRFRVNTTFTASNKHDSESCVATLRLRPLLTFLAFLVLPQGVP